MPFFAIHKKMKLSDAQQTLTQDGEVSAWVAGMAGFTLRYDDDDHHVETVGASVSVTAQTESSGTGADRKVWTNFLVSVDGTLKDMSGDTVGRDDSYVTVSILGYTGITGTVSLSNVGNILAGQSAVVQLPFAPTGGVCQPVLAGFTVGFGSADGDQHVMDQSAGVSQTTQDSQVTVSAEASMEDASNNAAEDPSNGVTAGLIAVAGPVNEAGLELVPVQTQDSLYTVSFSRKVASAAVFLVSEKVAYGTSEDFHVQTIGAGPLDWTLADDGMSVTLTRPGGEISDAGSDHADPGLTKVSLVVAGCH